MPDIPTYVKVEGIYERVYAITQTYDMRLPEVTIFPTELGGIVLKTTQISDNKFEFKSEGILKPNFPRGKIYEIKVHDLQVWKEDRRTVGKNIYLNGILLKAVYFIGDQELAKFRIDKYGNVYDVFD